ncbi:MAG: hypothetical protein LBL79_10340, partial [Prevotella sp.]|nr:hypothetical protein [Prevotella sp.]
MASHKFSASFAPFVVPKLFISSYFPEDLLTTTTLIVPERFFFLRTYMLQIYAFLDCATLRHPFLNDNSLIIIERYVVTLKNDEVRKSVFVCDCRPLSVILHHI